MSSITRQKGSATIWLLVATSALLPVVMLLTSFVFVSAAELHLRQIANVAALAGAKVLDVPGAGCATARATIEHALGGWPTELTECRIESAGQGSLFLTVRATPPPLLPGFVYRLLPRVIRVSTRAG